MFAFSLLYDFFLFHLYEVMHLPLHCLVFNFMLQPMGVCLISIQHIYGHLVSFHFSYLSLTDLHTLCLILGIVALQIFGIIGYHHLCPLYCVQHLHKHKQFIFLCNYLTFSI